MRHKKEERKRGDTHQRRQHQPRRLAPSPHASTIIRPSNPSSSLLYKNTGCSCYMSSRMDTHLWCPRVEDGDLTPVCTRRKHCHLLLVPLDQLNLVAVMRVRAHALDSVQVPQTNSCVRRCAGEEGALAPVPCQTEHSVPVSGELAHKRRGGERRDT